LLQWPQATAIGQREIAAIVLEFFVALLLSSEGGIPYIEAFEKLRALVGFAEGFCDRGDAWSVGV
jgi:hypothetical protein